MQTLRFRHHRGRAVAGFIVGVSLLTLVAVWPWAAVLLLVPAGFVAWVLRAGTDVDASGLRVRALLGQRRVGWAEVDAVYTNTHGHVVARLRRGTELPLTAVREPDVPQLQALTPGHAPQ